MSHLPVQSTSFVGRTTEIEDISSMLAQDDCRLVTIIGAGGMGKTRLAIATAELLQDRYPDGVYFVDLAAIKTTEGIVTATASVFDFNYIQDNYSPLEQFLRYLQVKQALLVLDNYEHLLDGADIVDDYLTLTEHLDIIVTSREPLNLDWEWLYQLRGMSFPESHHSDDLDTYSALSLFEARARRVQRNFDLKSDLLDVVRICDLVEGMPLGLEMAAAWLNRVPCSQLASEIEKNLDILTHRSRNVPDRHRSIRAVFDHSWSRLTDEERDVLVRLAVFHGGFTAEAAQAVTGANLWLLSSLVDRSMVRQDDRHRYNLHPLLVQYLTEMLSDDQARLVDVQRRHAKYFYHWLETNVSGVLHGDFFDELLDEFDNIIQTWYWLVDNNHVDELFNVTGLYREMFIYATNRMPIAEEIFSYARTHFEPMAENKNVARLLASLLVATVESLSHTYGYDDEKHQLRHRAYEYGLLSEDPLAIVVAGAVVENKDYRFYKEMVAKLEGSAVDFALIQGYLALARVALITSYDKSLNLLKKALSITRTKKYNLWLTRNLKVIGFLNIHYGHLIDAEQYFLDAYTLAERTRHPENKYFAQFGLRLLYALLQRHEKARQHNEDCLAFSKQRNHSRGIREYYQFGAIIERQDGNLDRAIPLFEKALEHMATYPAGHDAYANTHSELAWTLFQADKYPYGQQHLAEALRHVTLATHENFGDWLPGFVQGVRAEILLNHGMVALKEGELTQAVQWIAIADRYAHDETVIFLIRKTEKAKQQLESHFPGRDVDAILDAAPPLTIKEAFMQLTMPVEERPQPLVETISEREFDVLELLATGASNRDIARELFITLGTVKRHVHNISGKLGAENRTQVAIKAKELGLV